MNPAAFFIRRPVATVLLTIGIALTGIASYFVLPVSALPSVDFPTIQVSATLPGASPEVMATSVATPLERRLGEIADVTEMTSSSQTNRTGITLQFGLDRDINGAARDVQAAINASRADLPATLRNNPTYDKINPADSPILILNLTSPTLTTSQIYDAAAVILQQKLSQVQGVGNVDIGGGASPAVRVEMNPRALSKYGIALEDVRAAIDAANSARLPKGMIQSGPRRLQIYVNDQNSTAADYQRLLIAYRNGAPVRLSDVAQVYDGPENERNLGLSNGKPSIVVQVTRQPGANIIATVDRIKAQLPQLQAELPSNIDLAISVDRTVTIRASVFEVERTLMISIILVVLVVLAFLRNGRATLIPAVAVTTSLLGALAVMFIMGYSLDNLSLMALTVATGFVVDDAIVVLENITRHVENGMPRFQAALVGAGEVGFTVLSISISLIAVFIPILMMGGIVGRFFREFGVVLSASVVISLVMSLTTTPMLAARLIDERPGGKAGAGAGAPRAGGRGVLGSLSRLFERGFDRLLQIYEHSLSWALNFAPFVLLVLIGTVVLTVYLYMIVPKGFFPQQDTGQLVGGIQVDQATSFQAMTQKVRRLEAIVQRDKAVSTVTAFTRGAGGFMFVALKPRAERPGVTAETVINRLRPRLMTVSGAQLFLQSAQDVRIGGRQSNAQYQYTLQSDNLNDLHTWATKLSDQLKQFPALTDVNSDQQEHGLETYLTVDRATASRLGITSAQVDNVLSDAFGQRLASTIYNPLNQYHVMMEVAPEYRQSPEALREIYVSPASTGAGAAASARAQIRSGGRSAIPQAQLPAGGALATYQPYASGSSGGRTNLGGASPAGGGAFSGSTTPSSATPSGLGLGAVSSAPSSLATSSANNGLNAAPGTASASAPNGAGSTSASGGATVAATLSATGVTSGAVSAASPQNSAGAGVFTNVSGTSTGAGVQRTTTGGASGPPQTGQAVSTTVQRMVPLSAFASFAPSTTPTSVQHQGQSVATTISFNLAPGRSLTDAQQEIQLAQQQIGMPSNVIGSFQGTAQVFQQSLASQPILILAALTAVYLVLGILYESYIHPITVLSTLPSAGVGAVLALLLFKMEFDIIALIGVVLLIGIVKKNAIMIIDFALVAEREQGLSARDSIYQACVLRFRPILMTTLAAILGALPLALGLGEGGELRQPLGVSIIGGLIVSQFLTLITTPVVYLYMDRLRTLGRGRRAARRAPPPLGAPGLPATTRG